MANAGLLSTSYSVIPTRTSFSPARTLTLTRWLAAILALAIIALIIVWALVVSSLWPVVHELHWTLVAVFYLVAGIAWILPLKPLLMWMELGRWK